MALATAAGLGVVFALLIYLRRGVEVRTFVQSTREMLQERPLFGLVAGALAGAVLLGTWPLRSSSLYVGLAGMVLIAVAVVGKKYFVLRSGSEPQRV